jgi:hypothetical protein
MATKKATGKKKSPVELIKQMTRDDFESVNGRRILLQYPTRKAPATRAGRFLVADSGKVGASDRYVAAWQGRDMHPGEGWDSGWDQGHYFADEDEANVYLMTRIKREQNYQREMERQREAANG